MSIDERAQARIDIAKDVLKWIDAGKITSTNREADPRVQNELTGTKPLFDGCYFAVRLDKDHELIKKHEQLKEQGFSGVPNTDDIEDLLKEIGDAKPFFESVSKCEVCAKGAILYAAVTKFNAVTMPEIASRGFSVPNIGLEEGTRGIRWLSQWFDEGQLHLIEAAYEGEGVESHYFEEWDNEEAGVMDLLDRAEQFLPYDEERSDAGLRRIMQNIIDNGGTFCP